ncbi:4'-phosphopantetheinyl transferase family protein [Streptomyces beihaiensis]|uniref:4'-phosphopantetheinyl transferase superfamily protein n=1 Tax=Streptomyces beihaiensis TaxID=2984495 RepID=A0ABT3TYN7_9ACTN|nr:4'-phosphopantetheinyl transferase superfamily protein [Streptomyces beihaiensis]MCX3062150.1 4'-phosphopantetheinyl transferase superfamily protein [Streptomyces beihaiensis]
MTVPTKPCPPSASASAQTVDLWFVRPGHVSGMDGLGALDENERRRADAFRRPADRALYVSAHLALRHLLGARLDCAPREVRLVRDRGGRPTLAGDRPPVHFSLSHSAGLALLGIAPVPIGVDVQRIPSLPTADLCGMRFHPVERAELASQPQSARARYFTWLWTRKEAYLKGIGVGLRRSLAADYLGAGGPAAPAGPAGWTVTDARCEDRYVASVAVLTRASLSVTTRRLPRSVDHD